MPLENLASAKVEIEAEDAINNDEDEQIPIKTTKSKNKLNTDRLTITRKKVSDLTEAERNQLITDAQQGIDNDFFQVKLCKNGSTRIYFFHGGGAPRRADLLLVHENA